MPLPGEALVASGRSKRSLDHREFGTEDGHDVETHIAGTADVQKRYSAASRRRRSCLTRVTASAGHPARSVRRVFTSQNTTVLPRAQTRSISPALLRQLRSTIW